jgi:flagellar hook assembly protein FlgD
MAAAVVLVMMGASAAQAAYPAPQVHITSPIDGAVKAGSFDVSADTTTGGPYVATLTDNGSFVATTAVFTPSGGTDAYTVTFASWDSRTVSNGTHQLAIGVTDAIARTTTDTISVDIENPGVTNVGASPSPFSPDKDGVKDVTTISYKLASSSIVTVLVKDSHNVVVGTLVSAQSQVAGDHSVVWNGLLSGNPDLPNGTYTVHISSSSGGATANASTPVVISCLKAGSSIRPSASAFKYGGSVGVYVKLNKWSYVDVGVYDVTGKKLVKKLLPKALRNRNMSVRGYIFTWNGRNSGGVKVKPGLYLLKAVTTNQAGSQSSIANVRVKGVKWILIIRGLLRLFWMDGVVFGPSAPAAGPSWADWKVNGLKVAVFPLAMGKSGWSTPVGHTFIEKKAKWPTWYPPAWAGSSGPVPGGKSNPLGPRALYLSPNNYSSGYRIHGTNDPSSIGHYASHGCIRMFPKDVIWLYNQVPVGTKVWVSANLPRAYNLVGPNKPSAPHLRNY